MAAARLGLDPYTVEPAIAAQIEHAAEQLDDLLLDELLGAVRPDHIDFGLDWINTSSSTIAASRGKPNADLELLRSSSKKSVIAPSVFPWDVGYAQARHVRATLGIAASQPFEIEFASIMEVDSIDRGLEALGGEAPNGAASLVLGRPMPEEATRFSSARALWHFVFETDRSRFLLTSAHAERQEVERAFAAELLAPADGLREHLRDRAGDVLSEADVDELAGHFRVSSWLVGHQIENQLTAATAGESTQA